MKTEDERLLREFCAGRVISKVEFPAPDKIQILFEGNTGIEISEPRADAKGLVVRMIHSTHESSA
jgi:hypothetical protein